MKTYKPICIRKDIYGKCIDTPLSRNPSHSSTRFPKPKPKQKPKKPKSKPKPQKVGKTRVLTSTRPALELRPTHTLTFAESMKARLAEAARINNMEGAAAADLYLKDPIHNGYFDDHVIHHDLSEKQAMVVETPEGYKVIVPGSEMPFSSKTSKADWAHNALAASGLDEYSAQTSVLRRVINNVHDATGSGPTELIGYSKGGQQVLKTGREQGIETTAFNPHMTMKEMLNYKYRKFQGYNSAESTILRTTHDMASGALGWLGEGRDPSRKTLSIEPLEPKTKGKELLASHDLENFMNLDPNAKRFGGNAQIDAFRKSIVQSKRLVEFEDHEKMLKSIAADDSFNQYLQDYHSGDENHLNITPEKQERLANVWKEENGRTQLRQEKTKITKRMIREAFERENNMDMRRPRRQGRRKFQDLESKVDRIPRSRNMRENSLAKIMADFDRDAETEAFLKQDAETAKNEKIVDSKNFTTLEERKAQSARTPEERSKWISENPLPAARRAANDHMKMATEALSKTTTKGQIQESIADVWTGANPFTLGGIAGIGVSIAASKLADVVGIDQKTYSGAGAVGAGGALLQAPLGAAISAGGLPSWSVIGTGLASEVPSAIFGSILAMKGSSALDKWIRKHHKNWEKERKIGRYNVGSKAGYVDNLSAGGIAGSSMYASNLMLRHGANLAYRSLAGGSSVLPESEPLLYQGAAAVGEGDVEMTALGSGASALAESETSGIAAALGTSSIAEGAEIAAGTAAALGEGAIIAESAAIGAEAGSLIPVPVLGTLIGGAVGASVAGVGYLLGKLF